MNPKKIKLITPKEAREQLGCTYSELYTRAFRAGVQRRKGEGGYSNQLYYTVKELDAMAAIVIRRRPKTEPKPTPAKVKRTYTFKNH